MDREIRVPQLRTITIANGAVEEVAVPVDTTYITLELMSADTAAFWSFEADQVLEPRGNRRTLRTGVPGGISDLRLDDNETLYLAAGPGQTVVVEVLIAVRAVG